MHLVFRLLILVLLFLLVLLSGGGVSLFVDAQLESSCIAKPLPVPENKILTGNPSSYLYFTQPMTNCTLKIAGGTTRFIWFAGDLTHVDIYISNISIRPTTTSFDMYAIGLQKKCDHCNLFVENFDAVQLPISGRFLIMTSEIVTNSNLYFRNLSLQFSGSPPSWTIPIYFAKEVISTNVTVVSSYLNMTGQKPYGIYFAQDISSSSSNVPPVNLLFANNTVYCSGRVVPSTEQPTVLYFGTDGGVINAPSASLRVQGNKFFATDFKSVARMVYVFRKVVAMRQIIIEDNEMHYECVDPDVCDRKSGIVVGFPRGIGMEYELETDFSTVAVDVLRVRGNFLNVTSARMATVLQSVNKISRVTTIEVEHNTVLAKLMCRGNSQSKYCSQVATIFDFSSSTDKHSTLSRIGTIRFGGNVVEHDADNSVMVPFHSASPSVVTPCAIKPVPTAGIFRVAVMEHVGFFFAVNDTVVSTHLAPPPPPPKNSGDDVQYRYQAHCFEWFAVAYFVASSAKNISSKVLIQNTTLRVNAARRIVHVGTLLLHNAILIAPTSSSSSSSTAVEPEADAVTASALIAVTGSQITVDSRGEAASGLQESIDVFDVSFQSLNTSVFASVAVLDSNITFLGTVPHNRLDVSTFSVVSPSSSSSDPAILRLHNIFFGNCHVLVDRPFMLPQNETLWEDTRTSSRTANLHSFLVMNVYVFRGAPDIGGLRNVSVESSSVVFRSVNNATVVEQQEKLLQRMGGNSTNFSLLHPRVVVPTTVDRYAKMHLGIGLVSARHVASVDYNSTSSSKYGDDDGCQNLRDNCTNFFVDNSSVLVVGASNISSSDDDDDDETTPTAAQQQQQQQPSSPLPPPLMIASINGALIRLEPLVSATWHPYADRVDISRSTINVTYFIVKSDVEIAAHSRGAVKHLFVGNRTSLFSDNVFLGWFPIRPFSLVVVQSFETITVTGRGTGSGSSNGDDDNNNEDGDAFVVVDVRNTFMITPHAFIVEMMYDAERESFPTRLDCETCTKKISVDNVKLSWRGMGTEYLGWLLRPPPSSESGGNKDYGENGGGVDGNATTTSTENRSTYSIFSTGVLSESARCSSASSMDCIADSVEVSLVHGNQFLSLARCNITLVRSTLALDIATTPDAAELSQLLRRARMWFVVAVAVITSEPVNPRVAGHDRLAADVRGNLIWVINVPSVEDSYKTSMLSFHGLTCYNLSDECLLPTTSTTGDDGAGSSSEQQQRTVLTVTGNRLIVRGSAPAAKQEAVLVDTSLGRTPLRILVVKNNLLSVDVAGLTDRSSCRFIAVAVGAQRFAAVDGADVAKRVHISNNNVTVAVFSPFISRQQDGESSSSPLQGGAFCAAAATTSSTTATMQFHLSVFLFTGVLRRGAQLWTIEHNSLAFDIFQRKKKESSSSSFCSTTATAAITPSPQEEEGLTWLANVQAVSFDLASPSGRFSNQILPLQLIVRKNNVSVVIPITETKEPPLSCSRRNVNDGDQQGSHEDEPAPPPFNITILDFSSYPTVLFSEIVVSDNSLDARGGNFSSLILVPPSGSSSSSFLWSRRRLWLSSAAPRATLVKGSMSTFCVGANTRGDNTAQQQRNVVIKSNKMTLPSRSVNASIIAVGRAEFPELPTLVLEQSSCALFGVGGAGSSGSSGESSYWGVNQPLAVTTSTIVSSNTVQLENDFVVMSCCSREDTTSSSSHRQNISAASFFFSILRLESSANVTGQWMLINNSILVAADPFSSSSSSSQQSCSLDNGRL